MNFILRIYSSSRVLSLKLLFFIRQALIVHFFFKFFLLKYFFMIFERWFSCKGSYSLLFFINIVSTYAFCLLLNCFLTILRGFISKLICVFVHIFICLHYLYHEIHQIGLIILCLLWLLTKRMIIKVYSIGIFSRHESSLFQRLICIRRGLRSRQKWAI